MTEKTIIGYSGCCRIKQAGMHYAKTRQALATAAISARSRCDMTGLQSDSKQRIKQDAAFNGKRQRACTENGCIFRPGNERDLTE